MDLWIKLLCFPDFVEYCRRFVWSPLRHFCLCLLGEHKRSESARVSRCKRSTATDEQLYGLETLSPHSQMQRAVPARSRVCRFGFNIESQIEKDADAFGVSGTCKACKYRFVHCAQSSDNLRIFSNHPRSQQILAGRACLEECEVIFELECKPALSE